MPTVQVITSICDKAADIIKEVADISTSYGDVILTGLRPVNTNRTVFCPCTGVDHIKAPKIIHLDEEWKKTEGRKITSTAEHTWSLLLSSAKLNRMQISQKNIGIIGYGRIGRIVSRYAGAFGMNQFVYDPYFCEDYSEYTLYKLLKNADIVTIHIPLNEETKGLIGEREFNQMKPGALLINTSRADIVNTDALHKALDSTLGAYANDFNVLAGHPKVIATPHIAGNSKEAREATDVYIAKKIVEYFKNKEKMPHEHEDNS